MTIDSFMEGATEEKVIARISQILGEKINSITSEGKAQLNPKIVNTIAPRLGHEAIRCLVLRDLDKGETLAQLRQSFTDALRRMFQQRGFGAVLQLLPHPDYAHVFTLQTDAPDLRFALHVAHFRWHPNFVKSTIDDYILDLALEPKTVESLAESLSIDPARLIHKIRHEIPDLMSNNGISLDEAKDYVRLYAAVIKAHTSPPVFADKTLKSADEAAICDRFASLLAALEFLRSA